jgi:hypothetical protein
VAARAAAAPRAPSAPPFPISRPPSVPQLETPPVPDADASASRDLARLLTLGQEVTAADIAGAEGLHARHPAEKALTDLLTALLLVESSQDRRARRYEAAAASLRRALSVAPQAVAPRRALADLLIEAGDWAGAEAAARGALALDPRDGDCLERLGYALFRQDRNREAAEALEAALQVRPSDNASLLLARIRKGLSDEHGMTEQRISHFNVRYDGEAHDEVGREILRALERHYATLVGTFDHEPAATIPVILFSRQAYYDASGAPAWSGGEFDHTDGRIRIPIQGLTSALTPGMDGVLVHELTHAFINDRSRGLAPREIHEGVAQYMEGKRTASMLSPEQIQWLAEGRIVGVPGFYLGALSFVEHLEASRGQGGINDLLRVIGETGSVDEGFRRVYGHDLQGTRLEWMSHLRQQYGG